MKNTNNRWNVSHPIYHGKKMTTKGKVTLTMVRDNTSPTGWKRVKWSPDNKICEFVEWNEKDIANANLIALAPEMFDALNNILNYFSEYEDDYNEKLECFENARKVIDRAEDK